MLVFLTIALLVWGLLHLYLARRLLAYRRGPGALRRILLALLVSGFAAGPAGIAAGRLLASPYGSWGAWTGWTYFGAVTILVALLLTRDLAAFVLVRLDRWQGTRPGHQAELADPERRRFLMAASGSVAVASTGALTLHGVDAARRAPEVVKLDLPVPGLPPIWDGYHIVQLSDIHVGETIDKHFLIPIIEQVGALSPDLIALTGDLVDGSVTNLHADVAPLGYLRARDGVFMVTGNHEYYSGAEQWCEHFRSLDVQVLNNAHQVIERKGRKLVVAGVTDHNAARFVPAHASNPAAALAGAPPADFRLLLAHQPRSVHAARELGFDLQLSGHTHGGQYFPWNLLVGLVQPLAAGLGQFGATRLYVNRGSGYWGPPLRTGVPAEITSIHLRSSPAPTV